MAKSFRFQNPFRVGVVQSYRDFFPRAGGDFVFGVGIVDSGGGRIGPTRISARSGGRVPDPELELGPALGSAPKGELDLALWLRLVLRGELDLAVALLVGGGVLCLPRREFDPRTGDCDLRCESRFGDPLPRVMIGDRFSHLRGTGVRTVSSTSRICTSESIYWISGDLMRVAGSGITAVVSWDE